MPKATETFSDSFFPFIGISAITSHFLRIFLERPATSEPSIKAFFLPIFTFL